MAVTFTCDGCGKQAPGYYNGREWHKPHSWFARTTKDGKQEVHACDRSCVAAADQKRGESVPVIPL